MSDPIVTFGRAVPGDLREWDRALSRLNTVVQVEMRGDTPVYTINESTEFPSVPTIIDAARAFLPPPQMPVPTAEEEVLTHQVFLPPEKAQRLAEEDVITHHVFMPPLPNETPVEAQLLAIHTYESPRPRSPTVDDVQAILAMKIFGD